MILLRSVSSLHWLTKSLFFVALLLWLPLTAFGHAKLIRSQPKANDTVNSTPRVVELWFSEPLESGLNSIEVTDQRGKRVDQGDVALAEDNKKALVNLGEITPGVYTVRWKALSADQHAMRGTFAFTVAQSAQVPASATSTPLPAAASPAAMQLTDTSADVTGDSISWGQTLIRWFSYLAMMILFGGFAFRMMILVPALGTGLLHGDRDKLLAKGTQRIVATALVGAIVLLVTSVLGLALQASDVFDKSFVSAFSPRVLWQVLGTGYGPSWLLQAASLIALIIILLLLSKRLKRDSDTAALLWVGLILSAVLLAAPTWIGHAMLSARHFRLAVISDWLHLVAGGFWVGGLFHLALSGRTIMSIAQQDRRAVLLHHLGRSFTRVAMPSVVLLVLAGSYNSWAHVPSLNALWTTPYGRALALKLLLVLLMLFLGALNNYYFGKRAARLVNENNSNPDSAIELQHGFLRSVRFEAALGIIVLLVTAVLVFLTPAREHASMVNTTVLEETRQ